MNFQKWVCLCALAATLQTTVFCTDALAQEGPKNPESTEGDLETHITSQEAQQFFENLKPHELSAPAASCEQMGLVAEECGFIQDTITSQLNDLEELVPILADAQTHWADYRTELLPYLAKMRAELFERYEVFEEKYKNDPVGLEKVIRNDGVEVIWPGLGRMKMTLVRDTATRDAKGKKVPGRVRQVALFFDAKTDNAILIWDKGDFHFDEKTQTFDSPQLRQATAGLRLRGGPLGPDNLKLGRWKVDYLEFNVDNLPTSKVVTNDRLYRVPYEPYHPKNWTKFSGKGLTQYISDQLWYARRDSDFSDYFWGITLGGFSQGLVQYILGRMTGSLGGNGWIAPVFSAGLGSTLGIKQKSYNRLTSEGRAQGWKRTPISFFAKTILLFATGRSSALITATFWATVSLDTSLNQKFVGIPNQEIFAFRRETNLNGGRFRFSILGREVQGDRESVERMLMTIFMLPFKQLDNIWKTHFQLPGVDIWSQWLPHNHVVQSLAHTSLPVVQMSTAALIYYLTGIYFKYKAEAPLTDTWTEYRRNIAREMLENRREFWRKFYDPSPWSSTPEDRTMRFLRDAKPVSDGDSVEVKNVVIMKGPSETKSVDPLKSLAPGSWRSDFLAACEKKFDRFKGRIGSFKGKR